ncbi:hypothetical protein KJ603_02275 [Patescibacteria group bacterium]|nr:hypothetical protein [Patescibacteria group bacterium]
MFLKDAEEIVLPFLNHPDLEKLENENEELKTLLEKIREKTKSFGNHPLCQGFIKIDEETKKMFLRYAEICKENLQF